MGNLFLFICFLVWPRDNFLSFFVYIMPFLLYPGILTGGVGVFCQKLSGDQGCEVKRWGVQKEGALGWGVFLKFCFAEYISKKGGRQFGG